MPKSSNAHIYFGMPRSGTSLVEQIISSHSEVHGAGELSLINKFGYEILHKTKPINRKAIKSFRNAYLTELQKIIDK